MDWLAHRIPATIGSEIAIEARLRKCGYLHVASHIILSETSTGNDDYRLFNGSGGNILLVHCNNWTEMCNQKTFSYLNPFIFLFPLFFCLITLTDRNIFVFI